MNSVHPVICGSTRQFILLESWHALQFLLSSALGFRGERIASVRGTVRTSHWTLASNKCLGCHGKDPDNIEGSLDLRSAQGFRAGGDNGVPLVDPNDPHNSPLLLAVHRESDDWSPMPPKEAERLTKEELAWIGQWIEGGAVWPDSARQAEIKAAHQSAWDAELGIPVATSGGLDSDWTNRRYQPDALWAYRSVKKPDVPNGKNPIDWLLAERSPEGLAVAPRADRRTLLRRAVFDLTGLPPTPEQLTAFLDDPRPIRRPLPRSSKPSLRHRITVNGWPSIGWT